MTRCSAALASDTIFRGDLAEFLPALRLGELVHVGKGTTFGLGKYRLEEYPAAEA